MTAQVDCSHQWAECTAQDMEVEEDYVNSLKDSAEDFLCRLVRNMEIRPSHVITPDYVNTLMRPTESYLCGLEHNVYGIRFVDFCIRSMDPGAERILFAPRLGTLPIPLPEEETVALGSNAQRFIRYQFGPEFLDIRTVGAGLEFINGNYAVQKLRMVERHYFRGYLLTSYDFTMPFVMPNSRNTWEMVYSKPELSQEWKDAIVSAPWEVTSDSFYFVNDQLIMHNKAQYNYGH